MLYLPAGLHLRYTGINLFLQGIFGKKRQYGSHFYCQIGHQDGLFTGHCGENFFHDVSQVIYLTICKI